MDVFEKYLGDEYTMPQCKRSTWPLVTYTNMFLKWQVARFFDYSFQVQVVRRMGVLCTSASTCSAGRHTGHEVIAC